MASQLREQAIRDNSRAASSCDSNRAVQPQPGETHAPVDESILGDYRLNREIGRGGMGIVYEATQLSLRRSVALKILPFAAVLDEQQVARFRNEAQAAASLHHPHIVPVFAVGCERGVHYYSMQLIDGRTLDQVFAELRPQRASRSEAGGKADKPERQAAAERIACPHQAGDLADQTTMEAPKVPLEIPASPSSTVAREKPSGFGSDSTQAHKLSQASTVQSVRSRSYVHHTVELMICVAEALDFAHRQGVVHRDIKPSNLLVDSTGKIWVADFGLARVRGVGNLTVAGSVLGTARYMSPEQIKGQPQEIDHRTDIYALGITLYELLTLKPAFKGANRELLFRAIESEEPVPPRRLNSTVAIDLETIVLKAIAKNQSDRYATAGEMAADMRRFLEGKPTLARRPTPLDRAFKWAVRRQRLVVASLCMLLLAVLGLASATALITRESRLKDQAMAEARFHLDQAHVLVDRLGGLVNRRLADVEGTAELRSEVLREAERHYAGFLRYASQDAVLRSELIKVHYRLAATYRELGEFSAAEQKYRQAIAAYEALQAQTQGSWEIQADLALCWHNLAALQQQRGHYAEAIASYRAATKLQDDLLQRNELIGHHALLQSNALLRHNAPVQRRELAHRRELASRLLPEWAMTRNNYGLLLWQCSDCQQAVDLLSQTHARLLAHLELAPQDHVVRQQLVECRNSLFASLLDDDLARAENLLKANIADLDTLSKTSEPNSREALMSEFLVTRQSVTCQLAVCQNNLATVLGRAGQRDQALRVVRKAINELELIVAQHPSDFNAIEQLAVTNNNLGQLLWLERTDQQAATAAFHAAEKSLRNRAQRSDSGSESLSRLAGVLHNLGMVHHTQGHNSVAIDYLTEAMELQAQAVKQVPFHVGYRKFLEEHRELLDQVLSEFKSSQAVEVVAAQATEAHG